MPTPTPSTPTNTDEVSGVLNAAPPKANTYEQASAVQANAVKTQTASMGHNVFRPDVYKVSEGYVI